MDLSAIQGILDIAAQVVLWLVIGATVVVKITPTKSDDAKLLKLYEKVHKVLAFLPTLGVNPKTKELQEWYDKNKPQPPQV